MIQESQSDDLRSVSQTASKRMIHYTQRRIATGMIVKRYDPSRIGQKRRNEETPRLHSGTRESTSVCEVVPNRPVPSIQQ